MTDILLHVGLHKTGTTFLQRNVFPYIKDSVVYYDNIPVRDCDKDKLVIVSDERFTCSLRPYHDIANARLGWVRRLKKSYPDAKILIILRDKKRFVKSLYSQYVKSGGIYEYGRWRKTVFDEDSLDYNTLINMYKKNFNSVLFLPFEYLKQDEYQFIKTICDYVDRPVPTYKHQVVNRHLGHYSIKMVRILNNLFATYRNDRAFIFPHCLHPRFVHQALHWKSCKVNKKELKRSMWYAARKNRK